MPISGWRLQTPSTSTSARTERSASIGRARRRARASPCRACRRAPSPRRCGCSASATAIGGLFVITVASRSGGRRRATSSVVVPGRAGSPGRRAAAVPSLRAIAAFASVPARAEPRRTARRPRPGARRRAPGDEPRLGKLAAGRGAPCRATRRTTSSARRRRPCPSCASRSRITLAPFLGQHGPHSSITTQLTAGNSAITEGTGKTSPTTPPCGVTVVRGLERRGRGDRSRQAAHLGPVADVRALLREPRAAVAPPRAG